jgi:hypothetical protein
MICVNGEWTKLIEEYEDEKNKMREGNRMLDLENEFTRSETENTIDFKAKKPNENGIIISISFTKDEDEHKEAIEAIKEFFVIEVF